jgi:phosphoserine aminotransferase
MNATFVPARPEHEKPFLQACEDAGIVGIKGHRSAGGFRASMYNALGLESVDVLINVMQEFTHKNG